MISLTSSLFIDPISKKTLFVLHMKASQFLHFLSPYNLFKLLTEYSILKLPDKTALENFPFFKKYSQKFPDKTALGNFSFLKNISTRFPQMFKNWFTNSTDPDFHNIRWSNLVCFLVSPVTLN